MSIQVTSQQWLHVWQLKSSRQIKKDILNHKRQTRISIKMNPKCLLFPHEVPHLTMLYGSYTTNWVVFIYWMRLYKWNIHPKIVKRKDGQAVTGKIYKTHTCM